jgi:hypothetical protein
MTTDIQNRESDEGEELVAYLDGELAPDASRRIEQRLASDPDFRQQLRELDQAWEALDALPRASVDDDFARTTIEMVALAAQRDLADDTAKSTHVERSQRLRWALAAIVALAAGYFGATALLPNEDKDLVKDLPVIRQVDMLANIGDIAFLRELTNRWTPERLATDSEAVNRTATAIETASATPVDDREQWVTNLSPDEKHELWAQFRFFQEQTPEEKKELRDLAAAIAADPDKERLQKMLVAYGHWIANRPEHEKADLRNSKKPAEERIARIEQMMRQDWRRLSENEKKKLRTTIAAISEQHKEEIVRRWGDRTPQGNLLQLLVLGWALNNNDTAAATRDRLIEQLDEETQRYLAAREESRRGRRDQLLRMWIMEAVPLPARGRDPSALMQFFANELDNEDRARLAALPPAEFEAAVAELYDADHLDAQHRQALEGFFRGGRGRSQEGGQSRGRGGRRGGGQSSDGGGAEGTRTGEAAERESQNTSRSDREQDERRSRDRDRDNDDNDQPRNRQRSETSNPPRGGNATPDR